jgi:hypothetical protein
MTHHQRATATKTFRTSYPAARITSSSRPSLRYRRRRPAAPWSREPTNIPCLCSKVHPTVETFLCMDKVVYVASYCKRTLQPGSNCGSKFSGIDQYSMPHPASISESSVDVVCCCDCFNLQAITFRAGSLDALFRLSSLRQQWVLIIIYLHQLYCIVGASVCMGVTKT